MTSVLMNSYPWNHFRYLHKYLVTMPGNRDKSIDDGHQLITQTFDQDFIHIDLPPT